MEWLKKKIRKYISIDFYVKKEIEKQCEVMAMSISNGKYPWDSESRSVTLALQTLVNNKVKELSDAEVKTQVHKVIKALKISEEKFLDEIVIRLKVKQV